MTLSHMDMFLAHLDVVMTDFHKSKCLFTATITWAILHPEGLGMQSYSTLICTYSLKPMMCGALLPCFPYILMARCLHTGTALWGSRMQNWRFGQCLMWQNHWQTIESWEWSQFPSHSDCITCNHVVTFHSPLNQVTFYMVRVKRHLHNTACIKMSMCYKLKARYWWPNCTAMSRKHSSIGLKMDVACSFQNMLAVFDPTTVIYTLRVWCRYVHASLWQPITAIR